MRDPITRELILSLVSDGIREGRHIEYKRDRIAGSDSAKKEFLADVAAFANAAGGKMFLGIEEERDAQGQPTGIPKAAIGVSIQNADAEIRRLTDIIRTGIEPMLSGVQMSSFEGFPTGPVLSISIPRSHRAPHMVAFQASPRFYSRASTGRHPLDITEIRDAFLRAEDLPARIRAFRKQRVQALQDRETPKPMAPGPLVVVHVVPIDTFSDHRAILFSDILDVGKRMRPFGFGSLNHTINLDGRLSWAPTKGTAPQQAMGYLQVFRDGTIEAVDGLEIPPANGEDDGVSPERLEASIVRQVLDYAQQTAALPVGNELVVMVTLLGAKGRPIASINCHDACLIDRSVVLIPDVVLEREALVAPTPLKPVGDMIWQACGVAESPHFPAGGGWTNPVGTG